MGSVAFILHLTVDLINSGFIQYTTLCAVSSGIGIIDSRYLLPSPSFVIADLGRNKQTSFQIRGPPHRHPPLIKFFANINAGGVNTHRRSNLLFSLSASWTGSPFKYLTNEYSHFWKLNMYDDTEEDSFLRREQSNAKGHMDLELKTLYASIGVMIAIGIVYLVLRTMRGHAKANAPENQKSMFDLTSTP